MPNRPLTVAEYLSHMSRAVVAANLESIRATAEILASNDLDVEVPIGGQTVRMPGNALAPDGWIALDEMEIECESTVKVARDDDGKPIGLAMTLSQGLHQRGMSVKFKAKFSRRGQVEAIEILRDAANKGLQLALHSADTVPTLSERKEPDG